MKRKSKYSLKDVIDIKNIAGNVYRQYGQRSVEVGYDVYFADQKHICLQRANKKDACGYGKFTGFNNTGIGGPFWVQMGSAEFDTYYMIRRKE